MNFRHHLLASLIAGAALALCAPPATAASERLASWEGAYQGNVIADFHGESYIGPSTISIYGSGGGNTIVQFQGSVRRDDRTIPIRGLLFFRGEENFSTKSRALGGAHFRAVGAGACHFTKPGRLVFASDLGGPIRGSLALGANGQKLTLRYSAFDSGGSGSTSFRFNVRP
jgi:hypothetical protein